MEGQHEGEAPALRLLRRLRVEFGDGVGELGLDGGDGVAAEVRELRDLVGEHLLDGLGLEDALVGGGGEAVVEEGGEEFWGGCGGVEVSFCVSWVGVGGGGWWRVCQGVGVLTAVFRGLGEAAGSGAVVGPSDVVAVDDQRASEEVLALAKGTVRGAGVHVRQTALHVVVGEHADVRDTQGLEDVLLEVVVQ